MTFFKYVHVRDNAKDYELDHSFEPDSMETARLLIPTIVTNNLGLIVSKVGSEIRDWMALSIMLLVLFFKEKRQKETKSVISAFKYFASGAISLSISLLYSLAPSQSFSSNLFVFCSRLRRLFHRDPSSARNTMHLLAIQDT